MADFYTIYYLGSQKDGQEMRMDASVALANNMMDQETKQL